MKKKTVYQLIIDRSGSMSGMEKQVVSGYNEQLQAAQAIQKQFPDQDIILGVRFFDSFVGDNLFDFKNVNELQAMPESAYRTGSSTALLDAIGKSIFDIKTKFGFQIENMDTTVVVIIITDGYENTSRVYTYNDIKRMITELEQTEKWNFTFMGADLDAIAASTSFGIKSENSISFDKSDYAHVAKEYFEKAAFKLSEAKSRNEKPSDFFSIFRNKDIRKK